jgi:hypothetical protein
MMFLTFEVDTSGDFPDKDGSQALGSQFLATFTKAFFQFKKNPFSAGDKDTIFNRKNLPPSTKKKIYGINLAQAFMEEGIKTGKKRKFGSGEGKR